MRNLHLLLINIIAGILFSSFSIESKAKKHIISNLPAEKNYCLFINNNLEVFGSTETVKTLQNTDAMIFNQNEDSIKVKIAGENDNLYALSNQYEKLEKALEKYKNIERNNQWKKIDIDTENFKELNPMDSTSSIKQIRERLFYVGDLKKDSKSSIYDEELMAGVLNYKKRHGLALNYKLTLEHINQMNEPISNRINTIKLNMERCLQMPENVANASEYIIVNIPSYKLFYIKDGKNELTSDVFVGAKWTETEVLNSMMDKIVFSPYWNIPQSIIDNELKLKMYADKNYLEENNMEWNGGRVRQKPGPKNSLGLVKFMFPNQYDIYMHDTPAKSLFMLEKRTFSHGCVNIKDAKGLAQAILKSDPDWTTEKIDLAMNGKKETPYELKNKIPVYMSYFTAWVSYDTDEINFYEDIYGKDKAAEQLQDTNGVAMF